MSDTLRASMQDIIDEALKDKVFAGRELNLRQRLEIAKHLEASLTFHGYALAAHPVDTETEWAVRSRWGCRIKLNETNARNNIIELKNDDEWCQLVKRTTYAPTEWQFVEGDSL